MGLTGAPVSQPIYAIDFVATAATGVAMNDAGDVVGTSHPDTGCGSTCLPPLETVVWKHGVRIVLPGLPGRPAVQAYGMNSASWVVGSAAPSVPGFDDHAVVWKPVGGGYQAIDLGVLPGTTRSVGIGIDDSNRAVGYSTTTGFPPTTKSFLWTEADGLVDLTAAGFPDTPVAISPGGTVATSDHWYVLGDLGSVKALASPPAGFGVQPTPTAINDQGDQARFLVSFKRGEPRVSVPVPPRRNLAADLVRGDGPPCHRTEWDRSPVPGTSPPPSEGRG